MKFMHIADCHVGGWREPKMSELTILAFERIIDEAISLKIDFMIIAGDLFNTSLPNIDYIKRVTTKLYSCDFPVYIVPGSHDFSPSGKTMLDVLENAGLVKNVVRAKQDNGKLKLMFTTDKKTGTKITGMLGKKNMLEKKYYENLDYSSIEKEEGFKIFVFHSALDELKPVEMAKMESSPLSMLPKGFDYYAGGHVHIVENKTIEGYKNVIYPGPLFPNSFSELEKLDSGSYTLYEDGQVMQKKLELKQIIKCFIECDGKSAEDVEKELRDFFNDKDVKDYIILIRLKGMLKIGRVHDIDFKSLFSLLYEKGAYFIMKNASGVSSPEFEEVKKNVSTEDIEQEIISEHLGQVKVDCIDDEKGVVMKLISALGAEKNDGETNATYEERILKDADVLNDI